MKIQGILIVPDNNKDNFGCYKYKLDYKDYKSIQKILECSMASYIKLKIGKGYYCIWSDEDGKLKEHRIVSAKIYNKNKKQIDCMVGNLFITNIINGKIKSLDNFQCKEILKHIENNILKAKYYIGE